MLYNKILQYVMWYLNETCLPILACNITETYQIDLNHFSFMVRRLNDCWNTHDTHVCTSGVIQHGANILNNILAGERFIFKAIACGKWYFLLTFDFVKSFLDVWWLIVTLLWKESTSVWLIRNCPSHITRHWDIVVDLSLCDKVMSILPTTANHYREYNTINVLTCCKNAGGKLELVIKTHYEMNTYVFQYQVCYSWILMELFLV